MSLHRTPIGAYRAIANRPFYGYLDHRHVAFPRGLKAGFSELLSVTKVSLQKGMLQSKFSVLSEVTDNLSPPPLHHYHKSSCISLYQIGTLTLVKQQRSIKAPLSSLGKHPFVFHPPTTFNTTDKLGVPH